MKHYFQFLFLAAILLGSLIVFNYQKVESASQLTETPDLVQTELMAELPSSQLAASTLLSYRHNPEIAYESISGNLRHLESLNSADYQVRSKTLKEIHLELLPVLGIQSGQYFPHHPGSEDPPLS